MEIPIWKVRKDFGIVSAKKGKKENKFFKEVKNSLDNLNYWMVSYGIVILCIIHYLVKLDISE